MVSTKKAIRIAAIGVLLLFALIPSSLVAQSLPRLESLTFSYGYLTPAFDPENYGLYELFINDSDTDVALEVTAIPENPSWVVSVGGIEFSGGGTFLISEFNEGFAISVGNKEIQNYSIQPAPGDVIAPGFGLLDLEIRPESIMMDNPFSPGDDEIHGGFDDPDNPPDQIELIAIFEGDSMTIGGVPGTSGELLRFEFAPYSPWLDLEIKIVAPGGGFTNLYRLRLSRNALSGMVFAESNFNQVGAHGFPPEGTVTVQIWTEPGGTLLAEVSGPADSHTTWMLAEEGIPVDLQPGMEVVASNGEVTARHVILPVTTDEVNLDTDIEKGSGPSGTGIAMHLSLEGNIDRPEGYEPLSFGSPWPHDVEEDEYDPQFIINASGHWQIDLGALGVDLTELAIIDLETSLDRRITRENYDLLDHAAGTTAVFWPGETHEPEILITLNLDVVTLEGATPGLPAEVEVRDAAGGFALLRYRHHRCQRRSVLGHGSLA